MKVKRLGFRNYRNLEEAELYPGDGVNVVYGDNAQGKTNLLEAIWLFTGGKSFRGSKDSELVAFGHPEGAALAMDFEAEDREQAAQIIIDASVNRRTATLNGVEKKSVSALIGCFCAVVFSPDHLSLIKDGPALRRKFLDAAICQMKPSYAGLLARYHRTLTQRNTLLKDIVYHAELLDTLEIWDEKLSRYGAAVTVERLHYAKRLNRSAGLIYGGISREKEQFIAEYDSRLSQDGFTQEQTAQYFKERLLATRREDMNAGFTTIGPHRDDLSIFVDDKPVRDFGSQGQQRSCVLALKLAEASLLYETIGEKPVVLLDDVMSELDAARQDYLLNQIQGWQVFITCCDPDSILRLSSGSLFLVKDGRLQGSEK